VSLWQVRNHAIPGGRCGAFEEVDCEKTREYVCRDGSKVCAFAMKVPSANRVCLPVQMQIQTYLPIMFLRFYAMMGTLRQYGGCLKKRSRISSKKVYASNVDGDKILTNTA
jgi:hypothetical protein